MPPKATTRARLAGNNYWVAGEAENWELALSGRESRQASVTCQGSKKRWPRRWGFPLGRWRGAGGRQGRARPGGNPWMGMQDRVGLQGAEQRKGEGGWKEPQDTGVRERLIRRV